MPNDVPVVVVVTTSMTSSLRVRRRRGLKDHLAWCHASHRRLGHPRPTRAAECLSLGCPGRPATPWPTHPGLAPPGIAAFGEAWLEMAISIIPSQEVMEMASRRLEGGAQVTQVLLRIKRTRATELEIRFIPRR
jgi:hypothetical protein